MNISSPFSRRTLLGGLVTGVVASALQARAGAAASGTGADHQRSARALQIRLEAARFEQQFPQPAHPSNGDEDRFSNRIGSYSKGLPHDHRGEVDGAAYATLLNALVTGDPADFERITIGDGTRLVNPQAGLAFDILGPDSHALGMTPAPAFDSAQQAAEIAENYWMALTRDVPFAHYGNHPTTIQAASDLSRFRDFRAPRQAGTITPATLFRGVAPGDPTGPYLSQFFWRRTPIGAEQVDRQMHTALAGRDYMTIYADWLGAQNGRAPASDFALDGAQRYIRNGRDLGAWVRNDVIFQAYFNAMLILLDLGLPLDQGNPYARSRTQHGFGTFGAPHIATALCSVTTRALKAVWFQKWFVHRRLRPEVFAGRIHNHLSKTAAYPIHQDILTSAVLDEVSGRTGSYLLPMAYPEGAPQHPSYGAGHATVAGACVTILKAFFDESAVLPDCVEATADGFSLQSYGGAPLTVGGELNKLSSNVAFGRNIAGVHWRSDAVESLRLGEEVALRFLAEEKLCFNEEFDGFSLTRLDGTRVVV